MKRCFSFDSVIGSRKKKFYRYTLNRSASPDNNKATLTKLKEFHMQIHWIWLVSTEANSKTADHNNVCSNLLNDVCLSPKRQCCDTTSLIELLVLVIQWLTGTILTIKLYDLTALFGEKQTWESHGIQAIYTAIHLLKCFPTKFRNA